MLRLSLHFLKISQASKGQGVKAMMRRGKTRLSWTRGLAADANSTSAINKGVREFNYRREEGRHRESTLWISIRFSLVPRDYETCKRIGEKFSCFSQSGENRNRLRRTARSADPIWSNDSSQHLVCRLRHRGRDSKQWALAPLTMRRKCVIEIKRMLLRFTIL